MRCHNIFLIPLLFFYALSCGNSTETNQEKVRTAKKNSKPITVSSQKNSSKKNKASKRNQNSASPKIKAPDFNLADLDGNILNFSAYEGQVVMLTFWGTWCGPCVKMKKETWPDEKMVKFLKDKKVKLFMFDADKEEHTKYFDYYKVDRYPTIILLDKDNLNNPLQKTVGGMGADQMIQQMDKVL